MELDTKQKFISASELIIVETDAILRYLNRELSGKLILTNKRLVFSSKDRKVEKSFMLRLIQSVYIFKVWFFNEGFHFVYKSEDFKIYVRYPADWVKLIKSQMQIVKCL